MVASVIGPLSVALQSLNSPQRIVVKLGILDGCGPLFLQLAPSTLIIPLLVRLSITAWGGRGDVDSRVIRPVDIPPPWGILFVRTYAQSHWRRCLVCPFRV